MSRASMVIAGLLTAWACSPVTVSRIGPPVPPRSRGCDLDILDPGDAPSRPYRDLGVVALDNCPDYRTNPCRRWLVDAACDLGGQVAYITGGGRPDSGIGPVTFRVTVAAYAADLSGSLPEGAVRSGADCDTAPERGDESGQPLDKCVE